MASIFKQQYATRNASSVLIVLIVALGIFGEWGCNLENDNLETAKNFRFAEEIVPVRYMEIKSPDLQATYHFHPNEIPAIRIQSFGKVGGLLVIGYGTNKIVRGKQLELRPCELFYQPLPHLRPGDYIAYIRGQGVKHTSCRFTVFED